jgi:integrase
VAQLRDVASNMRRLHILQPVNVLLLAPVQEGSGIASVGFARVVADGDGEKFKEGREASFPAWRSARPRIMWTILKEYLSRLPNALRERELPDGNKVTECVYTPHSLRATAATLLLDSGVDIMEVKKLLGHRHVTTTQIYDKRRRAAREGASHKMPL